MDDQFSIYVGVDWATEAHQICILDAQGKVLKELSVEHTGKAISGFLQWLNEFTKGESDKVAVAIEVPRGAVVEAFLERNYAVFSINPKQLDRFRDRHSVAGAKDDSLDAFVAADSRGAEAWRVRRRYRSDHGRTGCQPKPPGRQRHRHDLHGPPAGSEAAGAAARIGSRRGSDHRAGQSAQSDRRGGH